MGIGELAQWLKVCAAVEEDLSLVLSAHFKQLINAYNSSFFWRHHRP